MAVDWLKARKKKFDKRSDIIVIHSIEGGGKTSFAAQFPEPTFMMSAAETGVITLASKGLIPEVEVFPEFTLFDDVADASKQIAGASASERPKTLVVDTVNGIELLLKRKAIRENHDGDALAFESWGGQGYKAIQSEWFEWIQSIEKIREAGTTVVLLSHTRVVKFTNPDGTDYSRYVSELSEPSWNAIRKVADLISFVNFNTTVEAAKNAAKGKGKGGRDRVYYFERSASWDAKQRHGLPAHMIGTGSAKSDFEQFKKLLIESQKSRAPAKAKKKLEEVDPEAAGSVGGD